MNYGKKIAKAALAVLLTVGVGLSTVQAIDADIAAVKHPHKLQQRWHAERHAALGRLDLFMQPLATGTYDQIWAGLQAQYKSSIRDALAAHLGNDNPGTNLFLDPLPFVGGAGPAPVLPANRTQGEFLTAVDAAIDAAVQPGQAGLVVPSAQPHVRISYGKINEIRLHLVPTLEAALHAWIDRLGALANTPIIENGVGLGGLGQPVTNQRDHFRDYIDFWIEK